MLFTVTMKYLEFIFNEFVYGGHWLSIGGSAIVLSIIIILNLPISLQLLFIIYLGTQCIYLFNHYRESESDKYSNLSRVKHINKYSKYAPFILSFYGFSYAYILFFLTNFMVFIFGILMMSFGLFFTLKAKKITCLIPGFKSLYVSFAWSLLVPFTAFYYSFSLNLEIIILTVFVFLRFLVSTNFFDIKDIKSDKKERLLTIPIIFDDKKITFIFLHFLNIMSFIPLFLGVFFGLLPLHSIFLVILFLYSYYYILKLKKEKIDVCSLSYVIVDGEFWYWPFLLVLGVYILG
jgi:4-hydroxybenzoate polyprenyltransferase